MATERQGYDHRLRELVVTTGDLNPVVCQNQIVRESCGIPVVVLQDPTEPLPALDRTGGVGVGGQRGKQLVAQPLVVAFAVILANVFGKNRPQVLLAERDHPAQTL